MHENIKVSVIVPIYNVDAFLHQCINSIVIQSLKEIEIILIDDGSSDYSVHICEYYKKSDNRVILIQNKKNEGLVAVRKTGIQRASGKYVMYVDADDWIAPNYIEDIYNEAVQKKVDAVFPSHIRDFLGRQKIIRNKIESGFYDRDNLKEKVFPRMISFGQFFSHGITSYTWGKIFLRSRLLEFQLKIPENIVMGEDAAVLFSMLPTLDSLYISDLAGYFYRQRPGSIVKTVGKYNAEAKKLSSLFRFLSNTLEDYSVSYNFNDQLIDYVYALSLMRIGSKPMNNDDTMSELLRHQNFPESSIICLYSSGSFGQNIYSNLRNSTIIKLVDWVDEDYKESQMCGLPVSDIDRISSIEFDYIFIAAIDPVVVQSAFEKLISLDVPKEKITHIFFDKELIRQNISNMGFCADSFRFVRT